MNNLDPIERLNEMRRLSKEPGGAKRVAAQRARGKLLARERLEILLDENSFEEIDRFVTHRSSDFGLADNAVVPRLEVRWPSGAVSRFENVDADQVLVVTER